MKILKRMMVALLALLPLAAGTGFADDEQGYSRLFVFGASLLDPGNSFAISGETAHPPFLPLTFTSYGVGGHRFTNGRVWAEVLAEELELTKWAKPAYRNPVFGNYAYAHARARDIEPDPVQPSLYDQVQDWKDNGYCTGNPMTPMNDTLFIMDTAFFDAWDVLMASNEEESNAALMGWLGSIAGNIYDLYQCGAQNLLVAYLPDMAAPLVPDAQKPLATAASEAFNYQVSQILAMYSGPPFNMNIAGVNFFAYTTAMQDMPAAFGLTNVTDTCVTPYVVSGAFCDKPDTFFWWDGLHPTKKVHALLGELALGQLPVLD